MTLNKAEPVLLALLRVLLLLYRHDDPATAATVIRQRPCHIPGLDSRRERAIKQHGWRRLATILDAKVIRLAFDSQVLCPRV